MNMLRSIEQALTRSSPLHINIDAVCIIAEAQEEEDDHQLTQDKTRQDKTRRERFKAIIKQTSNQT